MSYATPSPHVPPRAAFALTELSHSTEGIAFQKLQQLHKEHTGPGMSWCPLSLNFGWQLQDKKITTKPTSSQGCSSSRNFPQEARTVDFSSSERDYTQTLP